MRHFDFRVFNESYTLALSEQAFFQIMNSCKYVGLTVTHCTESGYSISLNTEEIKLVKLGQYISMIMTERGSKMLLDALVMSTHPQMKILVEKIQDAFEMVEQWKENKETDEMWRDRD